MTVSDLTTQIMVASAANYSGALNKVSGEELGKMFNALFVSIYETMKEKGGGTTQKI